jgi:AcrR family transcriptional regulator
VKKPGKREKVSKKTKQQILKATYRLLVSKGDLRSVSTSNICAAADLSRPTLYHHFTNKESLIRSVYVDAIEAHFTPCMKEAFSLNDPYERLVYMIRTFAKTICLHPELTVLIDNQKIFKDKRFHQIKEEWIKPYLLLRDTLDELRSAGIAKSGLKSSRASLLALGMIVSIGRWFDYKRKNEVNEICDSALEMVLEGFAIKKEIP